jgi:hypothetical protein
MTIVLQLEPEIASRLIVQAATQDVATLESTLAEFCQRWQIAEFYLFGSVLRDDFRPDSDIDVMVKFTPEARWGLLALIEMKEELEVMFEREVDLLTKGSIEQSENWIRREGILSTARLIYDAR